MRMNSLSINGYPAHWVTKHGMGDADAFLFGHGVGALGADTCFEYDTNGVCLSSTSDGGATVTPCTTSSGDTIASAACGSKGTDQLATCSAAGGTWANGNCTYPVVNPVSTSTAVLWLAGAALLIMVVR